jgi:pyruvate dehydrogenase E1 component alpha subunit
MRREHDAIERVRKALLELGVGEQTLKATDDEIKALVADAAEFAQSSPEPDPAELWTDILVEA